MNEKMCNIAIRAIISCLYITAIVSCAPSMSSYDMKYRKIDSDTRLLVLKCIFPENTEHAAAAKLTCRQVDSIIVALLETGNIFKNISQVSKNILSESEKNSLASPMIPSIEKRVAIKKVINKINNSAQQEPDYVLLPFATVAYSLGYSGIKLELYNTQGEMVWEGGKVIDLDDFFNFKSNQDVANITQELINKMYNALSTEE